MRKAAALLLILVLPAVGAMLGRWAAPMFARAHFLVQQADQVRREMSDPAAGTSLQSDAFRASGEAREALFARADAVERRFAWAVPIFGAFCGLAFALLNVGLNRDGRREIYEIDYAACLACGRCFACCPIEQRRRRALAGSPDATATPGATS